MSTRLGRVRLMLVGSLAGLLGVLLTACSPSTPPTTPTPDPATPSPSAVRTLTDENLIQVDDLPDPSDGKIKEFTENARPADQASICQHPLAELSPAQVLSRSFKYTYGYSPKPTSKVPLANEPSTYTFALQFASPQAAEQARQTYKSWIDTCRNGDPHRGAYEMVERGFDWTQPPLAIGSTDVAEVAYRPAGSKSDFNYWESSGLTVVDDRMMITIHLFWAKESLFGMHPEEDEDGYPHPQLSLTRVSADRLAL